MDLKFAIRQRKNNEIGGKVVKEEESICRGEISQKLRDSGT